MQYRITFTLNFDIEATGRESALEIAETQALEWLQEVSGVEADEITIKEM